MCKYKQGCDNYYNITCDCIRSLPREDMECFRAPPPKCLTCGEPSEWDECIYCLEARERKEALRSKAKVPTFQLYDLHGFKTYKTITGRLQHVKS